MLNSTFTLKDGRRIDVVTVGPSDATELISYINQVGGESDFLTFGENEFWLNVEDEKKYIQSREDHKAGFLIKGTVDGKIVSTLTIERIDRPRLRHIGELGISVLAAYWGIGVGRRMCEAAIQFSKEIGVQKINLKVRDDNTHAITLYEKLGFEHEGATRRASFTKGQFHSNKIMGLCIDG